MPFLAARVSRLSVSTPVKALAFLVFAASLAGATWGVQAFIGDDVVLQAVSARTPSPLLNTTAGHTVSFPVTLGNLGVQELRMTARLVGDGVEGAPVSGLVAANGNATLFVPVTVAATTQPGDVALRLEVADAQGKLLRQRDAFATLRVMPAGIVPGFAEGDTARVVYTGRTADAGLVFNTNDKALVGQPFAQTDFYQPSPNVLVVTTKPRPSVVEGFYEGMLGMQPGESRTITFPPEKGYGPAVVEETQPRDETLERIFELELKVEQVGRTTFDDYVEGSGQGAGADFEVGDVFTFTQGPNRWPYRIVNLSATAVDYQLDVAPGAIFTLYPFWENASVVESVTDTHVNFRTTPTTDVGETYTMRPYWPNMTSVVALNETAIVVRHDPPEGLKYSVAQGLGQPARDYTVVRIEDDGIIVSTPSTNPLAGKTLAFDVRLVELTKA